MSTPNRHNIFWIIIYPTTNEDALVQKEKECEGQKICQEGQDKVTWAPSRWRLSHYEILPPFHVQLSYLQSSREAPVAARAARMNAANSCVCKYRLCTWPHVRIFGAQMIGFNCIPTVIFMRFVSKTRKCQKFKDPQGMANIALLSDPLLLGLCMRLPYGE